VTGQGTKPFLGLLQAKEASIADKRQPIVAAGAGVTGLFTANKLGRVGYKNATKISEKRECLTSHNVGGLLAPV
jgi:hypothetical protein